MRSLPLISFETQCRLIGVDPSRLLADMSQTVEPLPTDPVVNAAHAIRQTSLDLLNSHRSTKFEEAGKTYIITSLEGAQSYVRVLCRQDSAEGKPTQDYVLGPDGTVSIHEEVKHSDGVTSAQWELFIDAQHPCQHTPETLEDAATRLNNLAKVINQGLSNRRQDDVGNEDPEHKGDAGRIGSLSITGAR